MSAAKRVARAAETVRARWERQVDTDPQTEAAQALEDTGQLLDPEVAAELVAFRALELGTAEGRVSAKCEDPAHPVWLRDLGDLRGCPWCQVAVLESRLHDAAMTRVWKNEDGKSFVFVEDIAPALLGREPGQSSCPCPPADQPGPHQLGRPLAEVPRASVAELGGA